MRGQHESGQHESLSGTTDPPPLLHILPGAGYVIIVRGGLYPLGGIYEMCCALLYSLWRMICRMDRRLKDVCFYRAMRFLNSTGFVLCTVVSMPDDTRPSMLLPSHCGNHASLTFEFL